MNPQISLAFQVTILGMGLVFASILMLWAVMAVLVRVTTPRDREEKELSADEMDFKQQAAVAAVVIALAKEKSDEPHEFPLPPTAVVSAWQTVMRTKMLSRRGSVR